MFKKYPVIYELPIFYLLLVGINFFLFPEIPSYSGIDPHPYWLGIFLFGFRYGISEGIVSGLLSASLYMMQIWYWGERYLFEDLTFFILPSAFVLGGTIAGVITERSRKKIRELIQSHLFLDKQVKNCNEELAIQKEINTALEKKIVSRMATLVTLYEGARRLESTDSDVLYSSLVEFTAKTLGADEVSLFLKDTDGWRLKTSFGLKEYRQKIDLVKWNEGIIGLSGSGNRVVSIRDFIKTEGEFPKLMGDALLAGPLHLGEKGEVMGVVAIQSIPFLNFNSATLNLFSFLLTWGSRALGKASYIRELKAQEIMDPEFQVYSKKHFLSRLEQELARSRKYYLPLSLALVKIDGISSPLRHDDQKRLQFFLSQTLKAATREVDVIGLWEEEQIPFAILFITASPPQADEISQKIRETFGNFDIQLPHEDHPLSIRLGLGHFDPGIGATSQLIELALGKLYEKKG